MDLCDKHPEFTNHLILNGSSYIEEIKNKNFTDIPAALLLKNFPRSKHINQIVSIKGTIIKTGQILFRNVDEEISCLRCNDKSVKRQKIYSTESKEKVCESCGNSEFSKKQIFKNAQSCQSIRIQDIGNPNTMSETMEITLEGQMSGKYLPGERIIATGIVFLKWNNLKIGEPIRQTISIMALNISRCEIRRGGMIDDYIIENFMNLDFFERRKFLINSFCPEIYGQNNVKLGLLMTLVGGNKNAKNNEMKRYNCHVLLLGDPGMGKSHFLSVCSQIIYPAVLTNGIGTSSAGLTTCAVKQGKGWSLEAGALVLADTGICCIDEFDSLKLNERSGLLESMEQQTLSVAKAGLMTTLNTRCSVIAAIDTNHRYNIDRNVSENTKISVPLLSRFDLIFGMFDKNSKELDAKIIDVVFSRKYELANDTKEVDCNGKWTLSTFRKYIYGVKNSISDKMCNKLSDILIRYYNKKKRSEVKGSEFLTIRMLEALIRLAEAHCRLISNVEITEDDIFTAILLMESTINVKPLIFFDVELVFIDRNYFMKIKQEIIEKLNE